MRTCVEMSVASRPTARAASSKLPLCLQRVKVQAALRPNNGQPTIRSLTDPPQTVTAKCPQSYGRVRALHRLEVDERTWY